MNTPSDPKQPRRRRHPGAGPARALERLGRAFGRAAAALWSDVTGAVMAVTAVMFMTIVGFAGLAIDVGDWYATKTSMQTAADAAAINAGFALLASSSTGGSDAQLLDAASQAASANGFDPNDGVQVDVSLSSDGKSVEVILSQSSPTMMASLFLDGSVSISAAATASVVGATACLLVLEASDMYALRAGNNSMVDAPNCSVQVNSTDDTAMKLQNQASITAYSICVTGGYEDSSSGGFSPTPNSGSTDCPPLPDPLADLDPPSYSGCDYDDFDVNNGTTTLSPGVYCGGINIFGNAQVDFDPGVYIIEGGEFRVTGNGAAQGTGVGFYLTDGATISFSGNADVGFSAPTVGPLAGVVFFQDRNDSGTNRFDATGIGKLEGTVYFPNGKFRTDANADLAVSSPFTVLIARWVEINNNARLVLNADYGASDVPALLASAGSSLVRLTN